MLFLGLLSFFSFKVMAFSPSVNWMETQFEQSKIRLLKNISPSGSVPGTVLASPSKVAPDYYYHWVRDASLVMSTIDRLKDSAEETRQFYLKYLFDYVELSKRHQNQITAAGLGEVKYNVDGSPFTGPWGRPQNDGPALRAMALIKLANYLLQNNSAEYVRKNLYDSKLPSDTLIKKDLEYVSHNWKNHDFDLWEECQGHHFFTRMAQRRAMLMGAKLARQLGDFGAADWYTQQAQGLAAALLTHWNEREGLFISTLDRVGGIDYKKGMDSSVIIAAIVAADPEDDFLSVKDDRFMSSLQKMKEKFAEIYSINKKFPELAPAIGRYPEDQYDGYNTGKVGNPWFINTVAFANYYYKLALAVKKSPTLKITSRNRKFLNDALLLVDNSRTLKAGDVLKKGNSPFENLVEGLILSGDQYMERVHLHAGNGGPLSEQINRESGYMQGADNLTWSHSSFIEAYLDRAQVLF